MILSVDIVNINLLINCSKDHDNYILKYIFKNNNIYISVQ